MQDKILAQLFDMDPVPASLGHLGGLASHEELVATLQMMRREGLIDYDTITGAGLDDSGKEPDLTDIRLTSKGLKKCRTLRP